jgi:predicted aldo/keto reductase-like oxidoreductase
MGKNNKTKECPKCGGKKIAEFLFGMPAYSKSLERDNAISESNLRRIVANTQNNITMTAVEKIILSVETNMKDESSKLNRREFLLTAGGAGLASVLGAASTFADPNSPKAPDAGKAKDPNTPATKFPQVSRRKLGKTGVMVPILSIGGTFDMLENQIVLRRALDWGINYWDTAYSYNNGNSELGIGKFLSKNKNMRKNLFIVTKTSDTEDVKQMEGRLQKSLERMQTPYVDLLFWHGLSAPASLTEELKAFAKSCKDRGLIKYYGFSTDTNMAPCLAAAARLDWIDVIMTIYNFREMQSPEMQSAIDACYKANIGLVAMKTQAKGPETDGDKKLVGHFLERGFTEYQAKLKVVWEDERIASICSLMPNIAILVSNVAAALDKTKLTQADMNVFKEYAATTCSGYCAGCANICGAAVPGVPIRDTMRFLMYHDSYGSRQLAKEHFAAIDAEIRDKMATLDYSLAEQNCPQKLPIGRLIRDAVTKLA